jgi:hypothetical protein
MDSGFRRNDGFWTFDEFIKLHVHKTKFHVSSFGQAKRLLAAFVRA